MAAMSTVAACSMIDEDLDDCNTETEAEYKLVYELRLVTNMNTELTTELDEESDRWVAEALRNYLQDIFTDFAHDVDLSFFDVEGDSSLLHHEDHIMDASQTSYTLYLPVRQYMHTAAANIVDNNMVEIRDNDLCHKGQLWQLKADTIAPHTTGLFSARLPMQVLEGQDQVFHVHLYMANCATALVLDTVGVDIKGFKICTTGFATDFYMADSVYNYADGLNTIVKADHIPVAQGTKDLFCSVNYPSPESPWAGVKERTRTIIETTQPFLAERAADALWQYHCYVTLPDGTITRSELNVTLPLRAGQLKIIKAKVLPDGSIRTNSNEVSVSVTYDWKPGLVIEA